MVFASEYFWTGLSLLLFIKISYNPVKSYILNLIDTRIAKVKKELEEVLLMKEEADRALQEYKIKKQEVEKEAESILKMAQNEVKTLLENAEREVNIYVERKLSQAQEKIKAQENRVIQELKFRTVDDLTYLVSSLIKKTNDLATSNKLVDDNIAEISKKFN
jgi:F0F1-type ATP synthase membrane subunit b/b'